MTEATARLRWLGQSGFVIELSATTVLVDAFLSPHPDRRFPPPMAPADFRTVDVIACTHDHLDHLDDGSLPALCAASPQARVVVPDPLLEKVTGLGVPPDRVVGMQPDRPVEIAGITIHAIPAVHGVHPADAYSFGQERSGGLYRYLGFVFQGGGVSVYHAGDTIGYPELAPRLRKLGVDVALLPINGRDAAREALDIVGNLDAEEAARLALDAGADVAVPMHYDMFAANPGDPAEMVAAITRIGDQGEGAVSVMVPARGRTFVYTRP
jgi:L-ascorbate 6-phosphate lactonase